jgi:hypothetical protein
MRLSTGKIMVDGIVMNYILHSQDNPGLPALQLIEFDVQDILALTFKQEKQASKLIAEIVDLTFDSATTKVVTPDDLTLTPGVRIIDLDGQILHNAFPSVQEIYDSIKSVLQKLFDERILDSNISNIFPEATHGIDPADLNPTVVAPENFAMRANTIIVPNRLKPNGRPIRGLDPHTDTCPWNAVITLPTQNPEAPSSICYLAKSEKAGKEFWPFYRVQKDPKKVFIHNGGLVAHTVVGGPESRYVDGGEFATDPKARLRYHYSALGNAYHLKVDSLNLDTRDRIPKNFYRQKKTIAPTLN